VSAVCDTFGLFEGDTPAVTLDDVGACEVVVLPGEDTEVVLGVVLGVDDAEGGGDCEACDETTAESLDDVEVVAFGSLEEYVTELEGSGFGGPFEPFSPPSPNL